MKASFEFLPPFLGAHHSRYPAGTVFQSSPGLSAAIYSTRLAADPWFADLATACVSERL